ncbi:MAG: 2-amino-4-hydroxy-6-hydroxymethyldihydropteridine diphosphokinase [Porphyromonadaceae bacterium]|nr:2-amino-4-hydroxy-6-hydroxymethyldihydropteridine diphosphokinase [Porphyromonadaceae bacterium]
MVLTIGSNTDALRHVAYVERALGEYFSVCRATERMQTAPIDFPYASVAFTNIVLVAETTLGKEEVYTILKQLEADCGRTAQSRRTHLELVPMDLDLIVWDGEVCKPRDLSRPYVQIGLAALGIEVTDEYR